MELFTPRSRTIMQLFMDTDSLYRIPKYQRPYKWVDEQVDQLWDDIYTSFEENIQNYFLGSIITASPQKDSKRFDIVDGQQRLTTLMILFCVVRDLYPNINQNKNNAITIEYIKNAIFSFGDERLTLLTDPQHSADFKKYIIEPLATLNHSKPKKYELKDDEQPKLKFQNSAYLLKTKLENIGEEKAGVLLDYLFNQVSIIRIDCIDRSFAIKLFQVLNDRGMDLTASDLIKSFLLEQIDKKYSMTINNNEIGIEEKIKEKEEEKIENENEFITEWRRIENILSGTYDTMNDMFTLYLYYHIARNTKQSLSDELQDVLETKDPNETIKDFSEFVNTYSQKILEQEDRILYTFWYLRWTVYWKSILLTALHTQYPSYEELKIQLRRYYYLNWIAGESLSTVKQISFNMISWIKNKKHINYISTALNNKLEKDGIISKFKKNLLSKDVYHTTWIKPLLVLLEYSLTDDSKLSFIELNNSIHTEHILPIDWQKFEEWKNTISQGDAERYLHSLGNLTLLSGSKNIAASNNPYSIKRNIYKGKGKYNDADMGVTAFELTKYIIESYPEQWEVNSIKERERYLQEKIFILLNVQ